MNCHVEMDWVSDVSVEPAASISRTEVSRGRTFLDCRGRPVLLMAENIWCPLGASRRKEQ
jgi:hypothetical protein